MIAALLLAGAVLASVAQRPSVETADERVAERLRTRLEVAGTGGREGTALAAR